MDSQASLQPYFENFGQIGASHADGINSVELNRLYHVLDVSVKASGRGILLRAPRAGFGKTHLLDQIRQSLESSHEFIPLRSLSGNAIDAKVAVEDALRRLTRQLPAAGGLTILDLHARQLLAKGLQPLVISGEVPCQDREVALEALQQRPAETFDFHSPQAVTAHWTRENFEILGPSMSLEISRGTTCSLNHVAFWLASLFRYAIAPLDHPGRVTALIRGAVEAANAESFGALLALLSQLTRIVLVVDELEPVHGDVAGARRIAAFLTTVRQEAPQVDVVISVNDDIWDGSFVPALSEGLLDRLTEVTIRLSGLDDSGIVALLESRGVPNPATVTRELDPRGEDRYARKILRLTSQLLEGAGRPVVPPNQGS